MKTIRWKGESRVLPGYGLAVSGAHVLVPDDQAVSFVAQDLAEFEVPAKASKKLMKEDES